MSEGNFYTPDEVRPLYGEIVPAYQAAFAGEPWYEVSKCADPQARCVGGLSSLAIGSPCDLCGNCTTTTAYEEADLVNRFEAIAELRPTAWYVEQSDDGLTLGAFGWKASPLEIASEKYPDVPEMSDWIKGNFPLTPAQRLKERIGMRAKEPQIIWLDEVFANKKLKPKGNLQNFGKFVVGLAEMLKAEIVAFRTIEPRMTAAAERDFGVDAKIFRSNEDVRDVPDRRDFVIINTMELAPVLGSGPGGSVGMSYQKVRKRL